LISAILEVNGRLLHFTSSFFNLFSPCVQYTAANKQKQGRTLKQSVWTIRNPLLSWRSKREIEMRHLPVISICGYVGGRQI